MENGEKSMTNPRHSKFALVRSFRWNAHQGPESTYGTDLRTEIQNLSSSLSWV